MTAPVLTVTSGPRNARTDPATGLRMYRWKGREVPSVTSLRRMAGLPHGLHAWMVERVISHALDNLPAITERLRSGDPAQLKAVRHELRTAPNAQRDQAADLGTAVHDAATSGKSPVDVPAAVAPRLRQYLDWLAASGAEVLAAERQVWNLTPRLCRHLRPPRAPAGRDALAHRHQDRQGQLPRARAPAHRLLDGRVRG